MGPVKYLMLLFSAPVRSLPEPTLTMFNRQLKSNWAGGDIGKVVVFNNFGTKVIDVITV